MSIRNTYQTSAWARRLATRMLHLALAGSAAVLSADNSSALDVAQTAGKMGVTFERGSDLPGFNDLDIAEASTAVPKDRGVKVTFQSPTAAQPVAEITASGYVKLDAMYDTHANLGSAVDPDIIPFGGKNRGHYRMAINQTRLRVKSRVNTDIGQFRALIETDFLGGALRIQENAFNAVTGNQLNSNSTSLRIRQAVGEWDFAENWTLVGGQTFTAFSPFTFWVNSVHFTVIPSTTSLRMPLLGLTHKKGDCVCTFQVVNPETDLRNSDGALLAESAVSTPVGSALPGAADRVPDLMASVQGKYEKLTWFVAGLSRVLTIDPNIAGSVVTDTDYAWGWGLRANLKYVATDWLTLVGGGVYGDGIGRHIYLNYGLSGFVTPDGDKIETATAWGLDGGFTITATKKVSFNGWYGYLANTDMPALFSIPQVMQTAQLNIIYTPVSALQVGLEGIWAQVRRRAPSPAGRRSQDDVRIQAGAWYYF